MSKLSISVVAFSRPDLSKEDILASIGGVDGVSAVELPDEVEDPSIPEGPDSFIKDLSVLSPEEVYEVASRWRAKATRAIAEAKAGDARLEELRKQVAPAELSVVVLGPDRVQLRATFASGDVLEGDPGEFQESLVSFVEQLEEAKTY